MSARVTLLTGPGGAGKTAALLEHFRRAIVESLPGQTLWIAPSGRSAASVRSQLLSEALPACFNPNIFTFSGFAQRILDANAARVVPLSRVMKRVLLRRVVRERQASGRLQYFAPVADKPGFVEALSHLISELKRAETWPEDFRKASRAGKRRSKDRELADLYEGYQDLLLRLGRYDAEGRFWAARDLLGKGRRRPFENVRLMVVDGFTDFTHTQYDILNLLAADVDEMLVSLPMETPLRRGELFAKTHETREHLQARLTESDLCIEPFATSKPTVPGGLAHLNRNVFLVPRASPLPTKSEGIEILEAVGQLGEVRMIAARAKQLLLEGMPAEDVVIVFRHLEPYAALVEEVFDEYGIPLALESGRVLSRVPALSALGGLLRLVAEDWPFRRLMALLRSNYLKPDWPEWTDESNRITQKVLRRIGMPSGREHYLHAIERLLARETERSASSDSEAADSEVRREEAEVALALLERFATALDRLPDSNRPLGEWVDGLRQMAGDLGFVQLLQDSPELSFQDARVWQTFSDALDHWVFAETALNATAPKISRGEFLAGFRELLSWEPLLSGADETGRVRVLSASQCRSLRVPYLFVGGMSEKSFPSPHGEESLYGESERHELNRRGLSLVNRRSAAQDEMLLFYQLITRAERRVVFSYPSTDSKGEPLLASAFLEDVLSCFAPETVSRVKRDQLDPVPSKEDVFSAAAARTRAVDEALEGRPEAFSRLKSQGAFTPTCDNILSALETAHARFQMHEFGAFDGLMLSNQARRKIAERFDRTYPFKPTELETYASCPFRFFLSAVLGVDEMEDPAVAYDAAARGTLAHRTLAGMHRSLNEHASAPCSPGPLPAETVRGHFRDALERAMGATRGAEVRQALAEIERMLLMQWGESYLDQHRAYDDRWAKEDHTLVPAHFEVAFGFEDRRSCEGDALSTTEPYVMRAGSEEVRFCGQIDRIDVGEIAGRTVINVIDYKTGSGARYSKNRVKEGAALQLPLYTLAAQHLLFPHSEVVPLAGGYWFVKERGFKQVLEMAEYVDGELREAEDWTSIRQGLEDRVADLVRGIRAAQFPVASSDDHCTAYCPYHTVCRIHQVRASNKTWELPPEQSQPEKANP